MNTALMLQGTATGFKRAIDLVKMIGELKKTIEINAVRIELQQIILDAKAAEFVLIERVRELEAQIADLKKWGAEKEKYELDTIASGVYAYALKKDAESSEPFHYICQNCYQHGKKSILQKRIQGEFMGNTDIYGCHECDSEIVDHESWKRSYDKMKAEERP